MTLKRKNLRGENQVLTQCSKGRKGAQGKGRLKQVRLLRPKAGPPHELRRVPIETVVRAASLSLRKLT